MKKLVLIPVVMFSLLYCGDWLWGADGLKAFSRALKASATIQMQVVADTIKEEVKKIESITVTANKDGVKVEAVKAPEPASVESVKPIEPPKPEPKPEVKPEPVKPVVKSKSKKEIPPIQNIKSKFLTSSEIEQPKSVKRNWRKEHPKTIYSTIAVMLLGFAIWIIKFWISGKKEG